MRRPLAEILAILHEPLEALLPRHHIDYVRHKDWFRFKGGCPWCRHPDTLRSPQCGIQETPGAKGLIHRVKCFHLHANNGDDTPLYADFLARIGALSQEEADMVRDYLQRGRPARPAAKARAAGAALAGVAAPDIDLGSADIPSPKKDDGSPLEICGGAWNARLRAELFKPGNRAALEYLTGMRGLTRETLERFHCGLTLVGTDAAGVERGHAWAIPLRHADGRFYRKYINYEIPGFSVNAKARAWSAGPAATYYGAAVDNQPAVIVMEGLKDLMRTDQALREAGRAGEFLLISSSNGKAKPAEWHAPGYWARWTRIYAAQDNDEAGEGMAAWIKSVAEKDVHRLRPPHECGKDWADFWQNGGTVDTFLAMIDQAQPVGLELAVPDAGQGLFAYDPINVQGAFHDGKLYYVTQALEKGPVVVKEKDAGGQLVERLLTGERKQTLVIRSDGRLLRAVRSRPLPGTRREDVVIRLDDGTLIDGWPRPNRFGTWSWASIEAFKEGRAKVRPLDEILADVKHHLQAAVWLPYQEDYAILVTTVAATYCQEIFDSVGYILMNGEPGTGKTQMGIAMSDICANGKLIGKISAASIARHIHESRGFVCLDDLEEIGRKSGGDEYTQLIQGLKVGYNKRSGVKSWTNMKTGMVEDLNFYGVKMINNTTGIDAILGTRTFHIQTRRMPPAAVAERQGIEALPVPALRRLRDELHTWAFMNVHLIDETYRDIHPQQTDRDDEIAAPLRTVARLASDPELTQQLELALAHQKKDADLDDPVALLKEAVRRLITRGYSKLATLHVLMEMQTAVDANFGKSHTTEIPEWAHAEWVGKQMRLLGYVGRGADAVRPRLYGRQLRVYPIVPDRIEEALEAQEVDVDKLTWRQPLDFCAGCQGCPYRDRCDLSEARLAEERRAKYKPGYHGQD